MLFFFINNNDLPFVLFNFLFRWLAIMVPAVPAPSIKIFFMKYCF